MRQQKYSQSDKNEGLESFFWNFSPLDHPKQSGMFLKPWSCTTGEAGDGKVLRYFRWQNQNKFGVKWLDKLKKY